MRQHVVTYLRAYDTVLEVTSIVGNNPDRLTLSTAYTYAQTRSRREAPMDDIQ